MTAVETARMKQELQLMLTTLSPTHEGVVPPQATPTKSESLANVEHSCTRLFDDPVFQGIEGYRYPLSENESAAVDSLSMVVDNTSSVSQMMSTSLPRTSPYRKAPVDRYYVPKKRSSLSKLAKKLMNDWFEHNLHHPYPTEQEKLWLAERGGIAIEQVSNWFINTRGRKWKPMLNRLLAEKQAGNCKLLDLMVQKVEEPYHKVL
uniref:Homeobox domain-containing protein n=1 Tax=Hyaloperonospora arabidopsidis (strain Emoy2) TaxID=559515 RepID=M4BPQ2_HYAAE